MSYSKLSCTHRRSRNTKRKKKIGTPVRDYFGLKAPRSSREALFFDKHNNNDLWAEDIAKKLTALIQKGAFKFHPPSIIMYEGCQLALLMWIFDTKKEDKRRKFRLIVSSCVVDASTLPAYSSVFQNLSMRLLLLISKANKLNAATGYVESACIDDNAREQLHSHIGSE